MDQRLRLGGGPVPLTLYDLTVNPPALEAVPLLVVENPSVLEAAMASGFTGAMACTNGHLRAVDHAFLHLAVRCGAQVSYAGDTDRDGLIIAKQVQELYGARLVARGNDMAAGAGICWPSGSPTGDGVVYQENDAVLAELFDT